MIPSQHAISDAGVPAITELADVKKRHFKDTEYQAFYVTMRDGVKIAVDVLLPKSSHHGPVATVLTQCRYMRSIALRWPLSILTNGQPLDLMHSESTMRLVHAGFAVVRFDVRGTGASFGSWRSLWSPEEQEDSVEILDWIVKQSWSSGKVCLNGVSYEAGAALFTLAKQHPAVVSCVLLYPFWDLFSDVSLPGGVPHKRFVKNWDNVCVNLDKNRISALGRILQIPFLGTQPVIEARWPTESVFTSSYWSRIWNYYLARNRGFASLTSAVDGHKNFSALKAIETTRFVDGTDSQTGLPIWKASQCHKATEIAASKTPMLLVTGWLDQTATAAISIFQHTAGPGSKLVIGPWTHAGYLNNSVGHEKFGKPSQYGSSVRLVQFLENSLQGATDVDDKAKERSVAYYMMGHGCCWKYCSSWPPQTIATPNHSLYLADDNSLRESCQKNEHTWEHLVESDRHPEGHSRWDCMTDMRKPMEYNNLESCNHCLWTSPPLSKPCEVTGFAEVCIWISSNQTDADIFCYLEDFEPQTGKAEYITEGCFRASHRQIVQPSESDPRRKATPLGHPHHSFKQADSLPLQPGKFAQCHFTMLPTSYCFPQGHCIRLAVFGSDSKHFYEDLKTKGTRMLMIRSGGSQPSAISLPVTSPPSFAQ